MWTKNETSLQTQDVSRAPMQTPPEGGQRMLAAPSHSHTGYLDFASTWGMILQQIPIEVFTFALGTLT